MLTVKTFTTDELQRSLQGKKIALFTNPTGIFKDGDHLVHVTELFRSRPELDLDRFFSPEHGIDGTFHNGVQILDRTNPEFGIPEFYMHSPDLSYDKILEGLDVVVYCIQEAGSLFYTFNNLNNRSHNKTFGGNSTHVQEALTYLVELIVPIGRIYMLIKP